MAVVECHVSLYPSSVFPFLSLYARQMCELPNDEVVQLQILLLLLQTNLQYFIIAVVCKVPHINNGFVAAGRKKAQLSEGTRLPNGNDLGIYCNKGYKRSSDKRKPWIWCTKDGHWKRNVTCIGVYRIIDCLSKQNKTNCESFIIIHIYFPCRLF